MKVKLFLKWMFQSNGVIATAAAPKKLFQIGKYMICYNPKPFRALRPDGPSLNDYKFHALTAKRIQEHTCQGCGVTYWGYGQGKYCGSWSCYKKVFGGKK
jgi:hypothetical protein